MISVARSRGLVIRPLDADRRHSIRLGDPGHLAASQDGKQVDPHRELLGGGASALHRTAGSQMWNPTANSVIPSPEMPRRSVA